MRYVKAGDNFIRTGAIHAIAARSVTDVLTKKMHVLGVGDGGQWDLCGMNKKDLIMIDNLIRHFPDKKIKFWVSVFSYHERTLYPVRKRVLDRSVYMHRL